MTKTTNYQLPKWEKTDRIQMSDFNDMTATLDAALGTIPKLAVGTYTGDGESEHTITLGFQPKFMVIAQTETGNGTSEQDELFVFGNRAKFSSTVAPYYSGGTLMFDFEHTATGIILKSNPNWSVSVIMNTSGKHYSYFAIG